MNIQRIVTVAFSPCGGTAERVERLANILSNLLTLPAYHIQYTLPLDRKPLPHFSNSDILIWASPVYAGRLPNKLTEYIIANLIGDATPFVGLVTFGNRSSGDALPELIGIARRGGCRPIGAAALVMPHVFSQSLAAERPSAADNADLESFARSIAEKVRTNMSELPVWGDETPSQFYTPLRTDNRPARFLKAMPEVDTSRCSSCGLCATLCPMSTISMTGFPSFEGICIKCHACIKRCPQQALSITDSEFLSHKAMLEENFTTPAQNIFMV